MGLLQGHLMLKGCLMKMNDLKFLLIFGTTLVASAPSGSFGPPPSGWTSSMMRSGPSGDSLGPPPSGSMMRSGPSGDSFGPPPSGSMMRSGPSGDSFGPPPSGWTSSMMR